MSKLLQSVDARTQLVGENRLELLLFKLAGQQMYALNVFKIQEVVQVPPITMMPHRHSVVKGVTHLRDQTISVIDLSAAIGLRPLVDITNSNMIVTEYNRSIQGFLVKSVDRIVNLNWEAILPPPSGSGRSHFLTAITHIDNNIVEILDVERVLAEIIPYDTRVSSDVLDRELASQAKANKMKILMADDSSTAMNQVKETLKHLGVEVIGVQDGLQALRLLERWVSEGVDINSHIFMLITDAEMPEMDGYRLTHEIRKNPALKDLYVVLHTSLSGNFNRAMVEKVGCNDFLSKFQPDSLANLVQERLRVALG
ncbi:chemotaxis protein CheV [Simiduia curdlanivorans]|uniref:Chemotaxis protein CheV n=1 Tax=Simiduia curdlanivorans TaxID=1492769 RepID=A0ABV8V880_9GAMM|nr:chemotaxis protein CheV [Simiduia curdlanivorans]MDN3639557.1 chemotaxis protein CheV [Simiduia curdlanivorans]